MTWPLESIPKTSYRNCDQDAAVNGPTIVRQREIIGRYTFGSLCWTLEPSSLMSCFRPTCAPAVSGGTSRVKHKRLTIITASPKMLMGSLRWLTGMALVNVTIVDNLLRDLLSILDLLSLSIT